MLFSEESSSDLQQRITALQVTTGTLTGTNFRYEAVNRPCVCEDEAPLR